MTDWLVAVIPLVIAVGGVWWVQRSTGAREVTDATVALLQPLNDRITTLEEKLLTTEEELLRVKTDLEYAKGERNRDRVRISRLERWAKALKRQVVDLGGEPVEIESIEYYRE